MKMSGMDWVVWVLLFIGGLNWGLVGAFDYNLVDSIFGTDGSLRMIVYVLVGLAALWSLFSVFMKGNKDNGSVM
ncbi:MAG: DUF378 domain-containing protein [Patescibacteria group bacterium]